MASKRKPLTTLLVTLGIGYVAICAALFLFQGALVFLPSRTIARTPADEGLAFREVELVASDGERLSAWFLPTQEPRGALLFCHGNGGNIGDRIVGARAFVDMGVSVLLFDYRGYGASEGAPSEEGLYLDAEAAFAFLTVREGFDAHRVAVYGESLGGAVAIELARRHDVACTITESAFASIPAIGAELYPWLPVSLLARIRFDNERKAGELDAPWLIVHSRDDRTVPFAHAERLRERARASTELLVTGGDHNDGGFLLRTEWRDRVRAFLHASLPTRTK